MQTQSSNAFLYLCKNFTLTIAEYYSELYPFLCQLYQSEFQSTKTSLSVTIDELSCPTLKLLDAIQTLLYHRCIHAPPSDQNPMKDFYDLVRPIYEILRSSLTADALPAFIEHLDLCSNQTLQMHTVRSHRRHLMLALHCLCLLLRYSKQQQHQLPSQLRAEWCRCLRPLLFDYVLKLTQLCNHLYDQQANPHYDALKFNLVYSETERQLYLGTYESNNSAKATIPFT